VSGPRRRLGSRRTSRGLTVSWRRSLVASC
jgi:hypothetical protein